MNIYNLDNIKALALEPEDSDSYNSWVSQSDIVPSLENEANDEYIILYASLPHVFIHTVFVPEIKLDDDTVKDLLGWRHNPYSSWGISCSSDDKVWIEEPLAGAGSDALQPGEQIIFARSFDGVPNKDRYFEINQKITHILGVHFISERKAWCKLDVHGDIEDVFKVIDVDGFSRNEKGTIICVKKETLGEYASIGNLQLIRMYDFSRYKSGSFSGWQGGRNNSDLSDATSIFGMLSVSEGVDSYSRGFQLVDIKLSKEKVVNSIWGRPKGDEVKQYCTYIADDRKNKVVSEISCAPSCLANYFTESNLPYETTPAFFRPEVLSKYKSDREKYQLNSRSISCRGTWNLKTFDINSAGQVHTYLIYLSHLPYEEQLHWKQYNEQPKAPLSERAIRNDFEGQFYDEYDPLPSLKCKLEEMHTKNVAWWKLRKQDAPEKVHYPYTTSRDEWAEEILNLDQLLIEGFEEKWLREKAKELGCNPDKRLRALKLIEVILVALGFEEDHAKNIMSPFHDIHNFRSKLKGHTLGTEAEKIRSDALSNFGSFRKHFESLCSKCDESFEIIIEAFDGF